MSILKNGTNLSTIGIEYEKFLLDLETVPNQKIEIAIENNIYEIKVKFIDTKIFVSLLKNSNLLVSNLLILENEEITPAIPFNNFSFQKIGTGDYTKINDGIEIYLYINTIYLNWIVTYG